MYDETSLFFLQGGKAAQPKGGNPYQDDDEGYKEAIQENLACFEIICYHVLHSMAHKKAGGTAKNLTDSNAKYLGVKLFAGEKAKRGAIIVRQRGTRVMPGAHVGVGKDHTLFALQEGVVSFRTKRKISFDGSKSTKSVVDIITK